MPPSFILALLTTSLLLNIILACVVRYLAIDGGFKIKTRQAGALAMYLAFGPRLWVYGDIDSLGLVNGALTSDAQSGPDRFNTLMRQVCRQVERRADSALVYGGDELRWSIRPRLFRQTDGRAFCERLQQILANAPLTPDERARLVQATGKDCISITLAYAASQGILTHRHALHAAKMRVQHAKPKGAAGQRGQILTAVQKGGMPGRG